MVCTMTCVACIMSWLAVMLALTRHVYSWSFVYTDKTCKKYMAAGAGALVLITAVLAVLSLTTSIMLAVQSAF
jgi:hypothetical protein